MEGQNGGPQQSSNAPWWTSGLLEVGKAFGVSAIILAFFLGQSAGWIPNPMEDRIHDLETETAAYKEATQKELQEIKGSIVQGNAVNQEIIKALKEQNQERQMRCVMKAKSDDEKKSCFPKLKDD